MKRLPIGYATLEDMLDNNCLYIDKTKFIVEMLKGSKCYFLSRPRRFGKSLFVDTLKQAFLGKKELFKGLYLENNWDWDTVYPVIHISFGTNQFYIDQASGLIDKINAILEHNSLEYGLTIRGNSYSDNFENLIIDLFKKYDQKVVILVDEYDKPILDVIEDSNLAKTSRDILRGLYSVIKDNDQYLKLVFLTGVSKFSKVGLFSGLNNLNDISLRSQYADICGYTQANITKLKQIIYNNQFDDIGQLLASHFAGISHRWYTNNNINEYEGFYASIVYSLFCALGYDLIPKDTTNKGQIDLTIKTSNKVIITESKLEGSADTALQQIKDRDYADRYKGLGLPIYLVGISFDSKTRNLFDYK